MSSGERLRGALSELGTTWIKFGQLLSLRPDLVGLDVAGELEHLQAHVPADPPGVAQALVESELGGSVTYGKASPPMRSWQPGSDEGHTVLLAAAAGLPSVPERERVR